MLFVMQEQSRYVHVPPQQRDWQQQSCITIPVAERQGILMNMTFNWHFF